MSAPGPRGVPLLGCLPAIYRDEISFLSAAHRDYGDVARIPLGPPGLGTIAHLLVHPDHIAQVLQSTHRYKKSATYAPLKKCLGEGLVTSEGETWRRHRRLIQPAFKPERLARLGEVVPVVTGELAAQWRSREGPFDLSADMMALTLEVLARTLFTTSVAEQTQSVGEDLTVILAHIIERTMIPLDFLDRLPTEKNRRFHAALARLDGLARRLIAERQADPDPPDDVLTWLVAAEDEAGGLTGTEIRDEVVTLLVAGHETTANALSWTWVLLMENPDAMERLRSEVDGLLAGRPPALSDLPRLVWTRQVLDESMRLYPPVWVIEREALEDDEVGGHRIRKGEMVILSTWVTHRSPRLWDDPERFDPERFAPERAGSRPPFQYFPFGGGQRACIGKHFALNEAVLVLADLAQGFEVERASPGRVPVEALITLRPRGGVLVKARER